ncbi:MAG TPA: TetR/AcrR family transcriptional regulator [Trueperaceae bacterium]|nr:TetR/AcrR family transcriptional regulator [Trueperaceae bacterium]
MARPKAFDHDDTVLKAAGLFRRQGYEGTSVRHLLDELGLSASSFYAEFGGKDALYMEALAAHAALEREQLRQGLSGPGTFKAKFAGLLAQLIDELTSVGGTSSLTLRAAVEEAGTKPEVLAFLSRYLTELIEMVGDQIATAAERGELRLRHQPQPVARFLLFGALSLGFVAKVSTDRATLDSYAAMVLDAMPGHATGLPGTPHQTQPPDA